MAAAGTFSPNQTEIKEILKCDWCKDILEEPRYLGCHHTFCTECLTKQITISKSSDNSCNITCPTCMKVTHLSLKDVRSVLKSNTIAGEIVKLLKLNALQGMSDEVYYSSSIQRREHETKLGAAKSILKSSIPESPIKKISHLRDFEGSVEVTNDKVLQRLQSQDGQQKSNVQNSRVEEGTPSKNPNDESTILIRGQASTEKDDKYHCSPCCSKCNLI